VRLGRDMSGLTFIDSQPPGYLIQKPIITTAVEVYQLIKYQTKDLRSFCYSKQIFSFLPNPSRILSILAGVSWSEFPAGTLQAHPFFKAGWSFSGGHGKKCGLMMLKYSGRQPHEILSVDLYYLCFLHPVFEYNCSCSR